MRRKLALPLAACLGAALAAATGIAIGRTYTLQVARSAVTNQQGVTRTEPIVVTSRGFAVYTLLGESARHLKCRTRQCFSVWPPVTVPAKARLSAQPGIRGRLGKLRRDGFTQVTLGGRPLYRFAPDRRPHAATGEGVRSFGGTWHVIAVSGTSHPRTGSTTSGGSTTTPTTTMTTTTTTTTCAYPPYC
jgi:predicted lipoprotein with Yx(FWY)xxD motif